VIIRSFAFFSASALSIRDLAHPAQDVDVRVLAHPDPHHGLELGAGFTFGLLPLSSCLSLLMPLAHDQGEDVL
jgi:hypothetical protein